MNQTIEEVAELIAAYFSVGRSNVWGVGVKGTDTIEVYYTQEVPDPSDSVIEYAMLNGYTIDYSKTSSPLVTS
jgi:hypothetical protein